MGEVETVAEFIEVQAEAQKLPQACARAQLHFERGETVAIYAPVEEEARELDSALWTFRQNAFIPHVRIEESEQKPAEPVLIFGGDPADIRADVLILLSAGALPAWVRRFGHVYDFAEVHDEGRRAAGRQRFAELKAAGYKMRFIQSDALQQQP